MAIIKVLLEAVKLFINSYFTLLLVNEFSSLLPNSVE